MRISRWKNVYIVINKSNECASIEDQYCRGSDPLCHFFRKHSRFLRAGALAPSWISCSSHPFYNSSDNTLILGLPPPVLECKSRNWNSGTMSKRTARHFRSISWWLKTRFATYLASAILTDNLEDLCTSLAGHIKSMYSNSITVALMRDTENKVMSVATSWPFWRSYQQRRYQTADLR